jgi:hypothetical protein
MLLLVHQFTCPCYRLQWHIAHHLMSNKVQRLFLLNYVAASHIKIRNAKSMNCTNLWQLMLCVNLVASLSVYYQHVYAISSLGCVLLCHPHHLVDTLDAPNLQKLCPLS